MRDVQTIEIGGQQVLVIPEGKRVESVMLDDGTSTMFVEVDDVTWARVVLRADERGQSADELVTDAVGLALDLWEEDCYEDDEPTQVTTHRRLDPLEF